MNNGYHVFNERLKQLDSVEEKCYYCTNGSAKLRDTHHYQSIYREQKRTNIIVYSSVRFNELKVGIPRCEQCFSTHKKAEQQASTWAWVSVIAIVLFSFGIFGVAGLIGIFVAIFAYFGVQHIAVDTILEKADVLSVKKGAELNPTVQEFIIEGWTFTRPSA